MNEEATAQKAPVDPFAPTHTRDHWAEQIKTLINAAEADGYLVGVFNDCCGCSRMSLEIGSDGGDDFYLDENRENRTVIMGDRDD